MAEDPKRRSGNAKTIVTASYGAFMKACWHCGLQIKQILEVAHLDQDRSNDAPENLAVLCPTCHRLLDVGAISVSEILTAKAEVLAGERIAQPSTIQRAIADDIAHGDRSVDWSLLQKDGPKKAGQTKRRKSGARKAAATRRKNNEAGQG